MADRPHTFLPIQAFAEAHFKDGTPKPSRLFQYYLLDTTGGFPPNVGFEANVFTSRIRGVNDHALLTVTGANCGLQTIGTVRVVLEPKPVFQPIPKIRALLSISLQTSRHYLSSTTKAGGTKGG
jgi:hypothetical protein